MRASLYRRFFCVFALCVLAASLGVNRSHADDPTPRERFLELRQAQREARSKTALTTVATNALDVAGKAISAQDQRTATQALALAATIARGVGNEHLAAICGQRQEELRAIGREAATIRRTLQKLDAGTASAEEATAAGKYYGLFWDDWEAAAPLLQRSEDSIFKQAGALEAIQPDEWQPQVELGAAWATIAERETGVRQSRAFERAHHWVRMAMDQAPPDRADVVRAAMDLLPFRYLTDLTPSNVNPGPWPLGRYGNAGAGAPIQVNSLDYPFGIGLHPPDSGIASVQYALEGEYERLFVGAAINDSNVNFGGKEILFWVIGDGKPLWRASVKERGVAAAETVDVSNVNVLELRTEAPGSAFGGHAVWLDPVLIR